MKTPKEVAEGVLLGIDKLRGLKVTHLGRDSVINIIAGVLEAERENSFAWPSEEEVQQAMAKFLGPNVVHSGEWNTWTEWLKGHLKGSR